MADTNLQAIFRDRYGYDITEDIIVDAAEEWQKTTSVTHEIMRSIVSAEGIDITKPPAEASLSKSSKSLLDQHINEYLDVFNSNPLLQLIFVNINTVALQTTYIGAMAIGIDSLLRELVYAD